MRKLVSMIAAMMLALAAVGGCLAENEVNSKEVLGNLAEKLESIENTNPALYNQYNGAGGKNRLVFDGDRMYFCWENAVYSNSLDGEDLWALTDTLLEDTAIAVAGGNIYFTTAMDGVDYFAYIKCDGSEMPKTIASYQNICELFLDYDYDFGCFWIGNIISVQGEQEKVFFAYKCYEHVKMQVFEYDSYIEQAGIALYDLYEGTIRNIQFSRSDKYKQGEWKDMYQFPWGWIREDRMIYASAALDGIRSYEFEADAPVLISKVNPQSIICRGDHVYFITENKLYRMLDTGAQKKKLASGVNHFVITDAGLLLFTTEEGLFAADENGKDVCMVSDRVAEDFYLIGDWVYYYTETGINRINLHNGVEDTVFDQDWL